MLGDNENFLCNLFNYPHLSLPLLYLQLIKSKRFHYICALFTCEYARACNNDITAWRIQFTPLKYVKQFKE